MNIQELNEKNSARAKALAEELGVEFRVPDMNASAKKAIQRMESIAEYRSNPELYDKAMTDLLKLVSTDELLQIIEKLQSTEN